MSGKKKNLGKKQRQGILLNRLTVLILIVITSYACVPTKKITYLQNESDKDKGHQVDSVVRSYTLKKPIYRLKPDDIISLTLATITEDEYNFVKKYISDLGIIRKLDQYNTNIELAEGAQGRNRQQQINVSGSQGSGMSAIALGRLNAGFVIDAKGDLELPEIGVITLAGLTIPEAELKVQEAMKGYFEVPLVRIQLLNYHFTIYGEVDREGRFTTYDPAITILDAISIAGNIGEYADRSNIKIVRNEEGEAKVIYLNLLDERTLNAENFFLHRDDIIIVPALEARTAQNYTIPILGKTLGIVSAVLSLTALILSLSR